MITGDQIVAEIPWVLSDPDRTTLDGGGGSASCVGSDGARIGAYVAWYSSGVTSTTGQFKSGTEVGEWRWFYPDGRVWRIGDYSIPPFTA